jgi:protein-disulfide isomerase
LSGRNLLAAFLVLGGLGGLAVLATIERPGHGVAETAQVLSEDERADVRSVVRRYLIDNPDVIVEALELLQARRDAADRAHARLAISANRDALFASDRDPVLGPDDATVTIVEFFDYQCPYCKQMTGPMMALIAEDKDLRVVFKEFPILGEPSVLASRAALAAAKQDRYAEFHVALMTQRGQLTEAGILQAASVAGVDLARLREDMKSAEIDEIVQANYRLADALGVSGTPAFVVGDEVVPGAVEIGRLRELIRKARAGEG